MLEFKPFFPANPDFSIHEAIHVYKQLPLKRSTTQLPSKHNFYISLDKESLISGFYFCYYCP